MPAYPHNHEDIDGVVRIMHIDNNDEITMWDSGGKEHNNKQTSICVLCATAEADVVHMRRY
jgi:hypothetical protein